MQESARKKIMEKRTFQIICGILCTTAINLIFIISNKIINGYELSGNHINFFKGLWQTLLFGCIILISHVLPENPIPARNAELDNNEDIMYREDSTAYRKSKKINVIPARKSDKGWLLLFGFSYGFIFIAFCVGAKLIPFAYYIVITATLPIFALLFSRCILRTNFTILKIAICISLMLGICMVVYEGFITIDIQEEKISIDEINNSTLTRNQPSKQESIDNTWTSFDLPTTLDGSKDSRNSTLEPISGGFSNQLDATYFRNNSPGSIKVEVENVEPRLSHHYPYFYIGIVCGFVFASFGALGNVICAKCPEISICTMMLYSGIGSLFFSIIAHFMPNLQLDIFTANYDKNVTKLSIEIILGFATMFTNGLLILANRLSSPTINSIIRRADILLVLAYDVIFLKEYPDAIQSVGYIIVLISVILITFADHIQRKLRKERSEPSPEQNPIYIGSSYAH